MENTEIFYAISGGMSFAAWGAAAIFAITACKRKSQGKLPLSLLQIVTVGIFVSTLIIFIPIYYTRYTFEDPYAFLRPLLIALHNTLRVFILDGEFDIVINSVSGFNVWLHVLFLLNASVLYVAAPIMTFTNVLSIFKNLWNEIRFNIHMRRPFYIFSELNEKSITLAESIFNDKKIENPVIVFTDVFEQNEEDDYEIVMRAHDIYAILLKKDIIRLNVKRKKRRVEFFLIGENESENVEQAIRLTQEYKNSCQERPISIFIYSDKPSAEYIIDSLDKGNYSLDKALIENIRRDPEAFLADKVYGGKTIDSRFYIRRIDSIEALVRRVFTSPKTIEAVFKDNSSKTVSVTILGMGRYGKEFLKQALWLFQIFGYKLEINVIYDSPTENGNKENIIKTLGHKWPEIVTDPNRKSFVRDEIGDANYDIRFFDETDCFSTDFDDLFEPGSPYRDRVKRTQVAIVSLGDDDKNIDAAVMLRSAFDRINEITDAGSRTPPLIYSVVYDDRKTANLSCKENGGGIVNYRGESIRIDFIGSLSDQYSYDRIKEEKEIEYKALMYHLDWLRRDETANKDGEAGDHTPKNDALADAIIEKAETYSNYEYYRKSSIARAAHEEILAGAKKYTELSSLDDHTEASVTEHMRWNVYMRTLGYRYSPERNDRAKLHCDLISWEDLPELEKYKDKD